MRTLGIDQSLTATGLCLFFGLDDKPPVFWTVDPEARRGAERLGFIRDTVSQVLDQAQVSHAAFEGYSYGSVGRVFELGEVGGVLRLAAFDHHVPFVQVAPAALKKFATGNPSADKEAVIRAAKAYGAEPEDDNQADAFFLAMVAWYIETGAQPKTRAQLEVLKKLRNPSAKKSPRRIRKLVPNAV